MTYDHDRPPLLDMEPAAFRAAAHAVVDVMADYLETIESRAVFPRIEPGSLRPLFPASAPEGPESIEAILADYTRLIEPNATHWQHPGFLAYFATPGSIRMRPPTGGRLTHSEPATSTPSGHSSSRTSSGHVPGRHPMAGEIRGLDELVAWLSRLSELGFNPTGARCAR